MKHALVFLVMAGTPGRAVAQASGPGAATPATSAHRAPHPTEVGLKGGYSRGDLQSSSSALFYSPFDNLNTFHVGGYWQRGLTRFASVQTELLYTRAGFRDEVGVAGVGTGRSWATSRLDYLALPVLFVGNVTRGLSIHLGPQVAALLAARRDGQALDLGRSGFRRFEACGVLGAEARAGVARVGLRYVYSLSVLNPTGAAVNDAGQAVQVLVARNDYHNALLQAYVGIDLVH